MPIAGTGAEDLQAQRERVRAMGVSLAAGLLILGLKMLAYLLTDSMALQSDALESIVNAAGAAFGLGAVFFAGRPADSDHPYGHGKVEFLSAAFEGGLISLAAVLIFYESILSLLRGVHLQSLGTGLALNLGAGSLNGLLGWHLLRTGRRLRSKAIEADGLHVLSDFWTTGGVALGLLLVRRTNLLWLDPVIAMGVGLLLARAGISLIRSSASALLDEEDSRMIDKLIARIGALQERGVDELGVITVHGLRAIRSGRYTHVDVHVVVPEYAAVAKAHDDAEAFEKLLLDGAGLEGECHTHIDPCRRKLCAGCSDKACPIRVEAFRRLSPVTKAEAKEHEPSYGAVPS